MSAPNVDPNVMPMDNVGGNPANTIYIGNLDPR